MKTICVNFAHPTYVHFLEYLFIFSVFLCEKCSMFILNECIANQVMIMEKKEAIVCIYYMFIEENFKNIKGIEKNLP